jgi:hypothetical protein
MYRDYYESMLLKMIASTLEAGTTCPAELKDTVSIVKDLADKKSRFMFTMDSRDFSFKRMCRILASNALSEGISEETGDHARGFKLGKAFAETEVQLSLHHFFSGNTGFTIGVHHLAKPENKTTHSVKVRFIDSRFSDTLRLGDRTLKVRPDPFCIIGDDTFTPLAWDVNEFCAFVDSAICSVCDGAGQYDRVNDIAEKANRMYDGLVARFAVENGKVVHSGRKAFDDFHGDV